jgi:hypothetical protein
MKKKAETKKKGLKNKVKNKKIAGGGTCPDRQEGPQYSCRCR